MYESYKRLIFGNLPSSKDILALLSSDLKSIDISFLINSFEIVDEIIDEDERLKELAILCRDKIYSHPEWSLLAGRIRMIFIHRNTPTTFGGAIEIMKPILGDKFYKFCSNNALVLESMIDRNLDWSFDIFATETLIKSYLGKINDNRGKTHLVETPQYKNLRIATYLWYETNDKLAHSSLAKIKQTYLDISHGKISPASPTQFNAGMKRPQLASCFLMSISDNIESLSKSWHDSAIISMLNGGIGMVFDSIRHSEIGNSGWSKGIVPWIKIQNEVLSTVDQGNKRKGSGSMYLTDWHTDIFEFIDLKEPFGKEEVRAKDLFYGIMVSDLFMKRVEDDDMWTLFCPAKTEGLEKTSGKEFEKRYLELEKMIVDGGYLSGTKRVKARELWTHILNSQISTGMPYICYKDAVNRKSNQQHMGTLRTSNLCIEINEYVDEEHIASCNLSSIPLAKFVKPRGTQKYFDFEELGQVTRRVVRNLGQTINRNYYPKDVPQIKYCNLRTRPLGIGVQDLAGCFALLDICWDSPEAAELNEKIARVMYYHGMDENVLMAEELGSYETFPGSPASKGLFQFDLWNLEKLEKAKFSILDDVSYSQLIDMAGKILCYNQDQTTDFEFPEIKDSQTLLLIKSIISQLKEVFGGVPCKDFDWETLRTRMVKSGLYFSLLFAQMPTASSAQILGNNESIECYTQLLYSRTVLSGQFAIVIPHLVRDLEDIGMWNNDVLKHLLVTQGSIQNYPLEDVPLVVKERFVYLQRKYRTAFEISQKVIANLYLSRAKYQCQASSNNVFMKAPTLKSLNAYHFYMWKGGAKTGMYYLRQMTKSTPLNFAISDIKMATLKRDIYQQEEDDEPECLVCGS